MIFCGYMVVVEFYNDNWLYGWLNMNYMIMKTYFNNLVDFYVHVVVWIVFSIVLTYIKKNTRHTRKKKTG